MDDNADPCEARHAETGSTCDKEAGHVGPHVSWMPDEVAWTDEAARLCSAGWL